MSDDAPKPPDELLAAGDDLNPGGEAEEIRGQAEQLLPNDRSSVAKGALRSTVVRSVGWVAVGSWGNRLLSLLVFVLLGRLLTPSQFGVAALAVVFITLFTLLSEQGFSSALVQKSYVSREDCDTAFWVSLGTATVLMLMTLALAPVVAQVFDQPELSGVLRGLSPMLLLGALAATQEALLERDFAFRSLTIRTLFGSILGGVAGVIAAALGAGVWALVAQALVTSAVQMLVLWRLTPWRPGFAVRRSSLRALRVVGFNVLGIELFAFLNLQSDRLLIGAFLGPAALGYYYVGYRIIAIMVEVQTSVIEQVSLTTLSKLRRDAARFLRAFYKLTGLSAVISALTFSLLALLAPQIIPLVFGDHWQQSVPIMQVLCLMGALNSVITFDRNALVAANASRAALMITITQSVVCVLVVLATVHWGALAVAIAVTARQYLVWPLRLRAIHHYIGVSIPTYLARWLGPMLSGGVAGGLGFVLSRCWQPNGTADEVLYLVVQTVLVTGIYLGSLRFTSRDSWHEVIGLPSALLGRRRVKAEAEALPIRPK